MLLGKRIRILRENRNLTQKQLAEKLHIPNQNISNYERGFRQPDYETLQKIADFFDVSTDYLLGRSDNSNPHDKKPTEEFDSLAEVNKLVKEFGIESFGFFDIEKWKNLTPEDVEELRRHFEWVVHKAQERIDDEFDE